jgi:uncharacterized protein YggE
MARQQAIRAAREKAVALAGDLGAKVGKPFSASPNASIKEMSWCRQKERSCQNCPIYARATIGMRYKSGLLSV